MRLHNAYTLFDSGLAACLYREFSHCFHRIIQEWWQQGARSRGKRRQKPSAAAKGAVETPAMLAASVEATDDGGNDGWQESNGDGGTERKELSEMSTGQLAAKLLRLRWFTMKNAGRQALANRMADSFQTNYKPFE